MIEYGDLVLAVDCETTGRGTGRPPGGLPPRLVQLGVAYFRGGVEVASFCHLAYPMPGDEWEIEPGAQDVHGITVEQCISEGYSPSYLLGKLEAAIGNSDVVVAHSWEFDEWVLGGEFSRLNWAWPWLNKVRVCTMKASTDVCRIPSRRGYKWPRLKEMHDMLCGSADYREHDALDDARAAARGYFALSDYARMAGTILPCHEGEQS